MRIIGGKRIPGSDQLVAYIAEIHRAGVADREGSFVPSLIKSSQCACLGQSLMGQMHYGREMGQPDAESESKSYFVINYLTCQPDPEMGSLCMRSNPLDPKLDSCPKISAVKM